MTHSNNETQWEDQFTLLNVDDSKEPVKKFEVFHCVLGQLGNNPEEQIVIHHDIDKKDSCEICVKDKPGTCSLVIELISDNFIVTLTHPFVDGNL